MEWMWILSGGLVLSALIYGAVTSSGRALRRKLTDLGTIGRSKKEIIQTVGPPSSISRIAEGQTILQWRARGYSIWLLFDEDETCVGVTRESAAGI